MTSSSAKTNWRQVLSEGPNSSIYNMKAQEVCDSFIKSRKNDLPTSARHLESTSGNILLTYNYESDQIIPTFMHRMLGNKLNGDKDLLIGMTGLKNQAHPIMIPEGTFDTKFSIKGVSVPTPVDIFQQGASARGSGSATNLPKCVLIPPLLLSALSEDDLSPEQVLNGVITTISEEYEEPPAEPEEILEALASNEEEEDEEPKKLDGGVSDKIIEDYKTLLTFLWLTTDDTAKQAISNPVFSAPSRPDIDEWVKTLHITHISSTQKDIKPSAESTNSTDVQLLKDNIIALTQVMTNQIQAQNNIKQGTSSTTLATEEKQFKNFLKLDKQIQQSYLRLRKDDSGTEIKKPTEHFESLCGCSNGMEAVIRLQTWNGNDAKDFNIQPGMALWTSKGIFSNTNTGCLDKHSPFFLPPRSGKLSIDASGKRELDVLAYQQEHNGNLSYQDATKLMTNDPFIPRQESDITSLLTNYEYYCIDVFGPDAWITKETRRVHKHFSEKIGIYRQHMLNHQYFGVYFIHMFHLKVQRFIARVNESTSFSDVKYSWIDMTEQLDRFTESDMLEVSLPKWFTTAQRAQENKLNSTHRSSKSSKRTNDGTPSPRNRERNIKRSSNKVSNEAQDRAFSLPSHARYNDIFSASTIRSNPPPRHNGTPVCLSFQIKGWCYSNCQRIATHTRLSGQTKKALCTYIKDMRAKADTNTTPANQEDNDGNTSATSTIIGPSSIVTKITHNNKQKGQSHRPKRRRVLRTPAQTKSSKAASQEGVLSIPSPHFPSAAEATTSLTPDIDRAISNQVTAVLGESTLKSPSSSPPIKRTRKSSARPTQSTQSWLFQTIKRIIQTPSIHMAPVPWQFERTYEAARHNSSIIQAFDNDPAAALSAQAPSVLHPGSEFREAQVLHPLLHTHPSWQQFESILTQGASYPMTDFDESKRKEEVEFMLQRGNHQSAGKHAQEIEKAYNKEVSRGWAIPILPELIKEIKGATITPLGVAEQWTINEDNDRIRKYRVTHDCSFPGPSGESTNNRIDTAELLPCLYGFTLLRILHGIHQMRFRHPSTPILFTKTDLAAAYRRIHTAWREALSCITIIGVIAYILLRLPFGASAAPGIFSLVTDMILDIARWMLDDATWNVDEIYHPHKQDMDGFPVKVADPSVPFAPAAALRVPIAPDDVNVDGYIDDLIGYGIDTPSTRSRIQHTILYAIHTFFRPLDPRDPIVRDDIVQPAKQQAEGLLEETKTILGWHINSRAFTIHLPADKAREWQSDICDMIKNQRTTTKQLESTIGRLNHAAHIIPKARYFLPSLRFRLAVAKERNWRRIKLYPNEVEDLKLWMKILTWVSTSGININHITFANPSIVVYSDACEHGLGGFILGGRAWRFRIPPHLVGCFSINVLEFMASLLTIELAIQQASSTSIPHRILAYTDSSSALGWLYHSTFDPVRQPTHNTIARTLATMCMENDVSIMGQHIKGKQNVVADSLSRDWHLNDDELTSMLRPFLPPQTRKKFEICPPPRNVTSWMASLKDGKTAKQVLPMEHTPSNLEHGENGQHSSKINITQMMNTYPIWNQTNGSYSFPPSQQNSETTSSAEQTKKNSKGRSLHPPSNMWQRPFAKVPDPTPASTATTKHT